MQNERQGFRYMCKEANYTNLIYINEITINNTARWCFLFCFIVTSCCITDDTIGIYYTLR